MIDTSSQSVFDFANGQGAIRDVSAESRAMPGGDAWFGYRRHVALGAIVKKARQYFQAFRATAALYSGRAGAEARIGNVGYRLRRQSGRYRRERDRDGPFQLRFCHRRITQGSPTVAVAEPADNAVGWVLVPDDAVSGTPSGNLQVACIGPRVARLFV